MVTLLHVEKIRSMNVLTFDNDLRIWLSGRDFIDTGWTTGQSFEDEELFSTVRLYQYPRALNQAVSLLARRPYSTGEIRKNLKNHHYTADVIDLVIYKLEKEKLLNDQEFSEIWACNRSARYGVNRLRQELRYKGVSSDTIDNTLSNISDEEQLSAAASLAKKAWSRIRPSEDRRLMRQKVIASLVRKGFDLDIARQASAAAEEER